MQSPESSLQIVQRALVLLTNHLESFRKRYAYHLRQWQLDRRSIASHHCSLQDKHSVPIHIIVQPASTADKVTLPYLTFGVTATMLAAVSVEVVLSFGPMCFPIHWSLVCTF